VLFRKFIQNAIVLAFFTELPCLKDRDGVFLDKARNNPTVSTLSSSLPASMLLIEP